jgi:hypothetical protein
MKEWMVTFVLVLMAALVSAQENYFYASWNYQMPMSNRQWLDTPSGHGAVIGYRFFLGDRRLSVGLDASWITFEQYEPKRTFQQDNGAITTDYYKYIYQYAGVISAQYYFPVGDSERFFPYAGLGLGANYNDFTLYYNIYSDSYTGWGFLARPEAGILVRFSERRSIGAIAAVHYDYSTNQNENFNYSNFTALGFRIGVVLMSR